MKKYIVKKLLISIVTIVLVMSLNELKTPIDLHYSQTNSPARHTQMVLKTPIDLHYSQTHMQRYERQGELKTPIDLHYSQTVTVPEMTVLGLRPP